MKQLFGSRGAPLRAAALLLVVLATSGCSHLFWDKRTTYTYKPDYGVDSPQFRRSLEVFGNELVPNNKAVLLENGAVFFPDMAADSPRRSSTSSGGERATASFP